MPRTKKKKKEEAKAAQAAKRAKTLLAPLSPEVKQDGALVLVSSATSPTSSLVYTVPSCMHCGKVDMDGTMNKCNKCLSVRACNKECWKAGYKNHKRACVQPIVHLMDAVRRRTLLLVLNTRELAASEEAKMGMLRGDRVCFAAAQRVEAVRGNAAAQYLMGCYHLYGADGVPADEPLGRAFLQQAATQGHAMATYCLQVLQLVDKVSL